MGLYGSRQRWSDSCRNSEIANARKNKQIEKLTRTLQRIREIAEGEGDPSQRMEAIRKNADWALGDAR